MQKVEDLTEEDTSPRILLIGGPGSGKTTLLRTLPGRTFLYIFDPNALRSLVGSTGIDYEIFLPDKLDTGIKAVAAKNKIRDSKSKAPEPMTYELFREHFENAVDTGFFDQYDNIAMDSFTTFSDSIMDRAQWINKRLGKVPEQIDYNMQMNTIRTVWRVMISLNKTIIATGHEEIQKDEMSGRLYFQPMMTGRLRIRIPLLFTDIFRTEVDQRQGKAAYSLHTVGDPRHQYVRCSLRDVDAEVDTTITDWKGEKKQGLTRLFNLQPMSKEKAA